MTMALTRAAMACRAMAALAGSRWAFLAGVLALMTAACGGSSPTSPSFDVAGSYSIQFNASASCRHLLPSNARSRTYSPIVVTQSGGDVTMTVPTSLGTLPMFFGEMSSGSVTGSLEVHDFAGGGYTVIGSAQFSAGSNGLGNGVLNGAIFVGSQACTAANHQLTVRRR